MIWYPLVLSLNGIHSYIMYTWLENWAEGSVACLLFTLWHYIESFCAIMLAYNDKRFLFRFKDIRLISLIISWIVLIALFVGVITMCIIITKNTTMTGFGVSLFLGYGLVLNLTVMPMVLFIVVDEQTKNIMERDVKFSVPGKYFSFYEYFLETYGYYGDDIRLHQYFKDRL
jgi:hypothetical protein